MLINIAGGDSSGKTTQIRMLRSWIEQSFGLPVRILTKGDIFDPERFPQCRFLKGPYEEVAHEMMPMMKGEARALLMLYAYAISVRHHPPVEGEIVLTDGYWAKTYATEAALGIDPLWLRGTCSFLPAPDVSVLLDIEPEAAFERVTCLSLYECGGDGVPGEQSFVANQTRVLGLLRELALEEKGWKIIHAHRGAREIFAELTDFLSPLIEARFLARVSA
jgi:thymidylate kinase